MNSPRESPTFLPLYKQVKKLLIQGLEAGDWKPGEMLPGEFELSRRFGVSHGTVRKAIGELEVENMLVRRQGKGTFVATHTEPRFLRLMPLNGRQEHAHITLLDFQRLRALEQVAKSLDINPGDAVFFMRRLLTFQGHPTVFEEISLPAAVFKGLTAAKCEERDGYLYLLFESEYGVKMVRADEKLTAVAANRDTAKVLKVPSGFPVLSVERVAFTFGDRPVELRRGFYRTDRHYYMNKLG